MSIKFEPTDRQLKLIETMQEFGCPLFCGTTKEEASEYIDKHMEQFKLATTSNWALDNGYF